MKSGNPVSLKLVETLFLVLVLLPMACSSESGLDDAHPDSFELLDAAPAKLLTDTRLQFINYWATWCLPCLEEMPELAAFRNDHKESVEVYAVNYDGLEIDQLRKEIVELGVKIPALVQDPNELLGYARPSVLPTTVVVLAGQVKEVLLGPQTEESLEIVLAKWRPKES